MSESVAQVVRVRVDEVYRSDSRRIFATLIRLLGDFDLAEEALQDAFTARFLRHTLDVQKSEEEQNP